MPPSRGAGHTVTPNPIRPAIKPLIASLVARASLTETTLQQPAPINPLLDHLPAAGRRTEVCWLAIDPDSHVKRWRQWANSRQLKVHNEAKRFGLKVLTDVEVAAYAEAEEALPTLQLAEAVDRHWSESRPPFDRSRLQRATITRLSQSRSSGSS